MKYLLRVESYQGINLRQGPFLHIKIATGHEMVVGLISQLASNNYLRSHLCR